MAIVTARGMGFHVLSFLCDDIVMLFVGSFEDVSSFAIITSDSSFAGKTSVQEICSLVSRLLGEVLFFFSRSNVRIYQDCWGRCYFVLMIRIQSIYV